MEFDNLDYRPGKSWNLIICITGLESHGVLVQVMESHGI